MNFLGSYSPPPLVPKPMDIIVMTVKVYDA